ncbi:Hypothetical protein SMAX5B_022733 [Scophthalmus maximus]|uniref:Uncharacterized protein n=1 Tax=Scophthalmus maximus TaxID=52904 RepID=A0A2U9BDE1_SCOMX|nr:Hypothetical protein SMAX5B_022733 [Scophthalmus maximus]
MPLKRRTRLQADVGFRRGDGACCQMCTSAHISAHMYTAKRRPGPLTGEIPGLPTDDMRV